MMRQAFIVERGRELSLFNFLRLELVSLGLADSILDAILHREVCLQFNGVLQQFAIPPDADRHGRTNNGSLQQGLVFRHALDINAIQGQQDIVKLEGTTSSLGHPDTQLIVAFQPRRSFLVDRLNLHTQARLAVVVQALLRVAGRAADAPIDVLIVGHQLGTATALAPGGADVSAFAVYGHVGRRFDELLLTPTLEIGGVYASGDDRGSVYKQFDPILPDPFTYGAFDVFGLSNHMGGNARLTVVPWTDATIGVDYRYARLARGEGEWIGGYVNGIGAPEGPSGLVLAPTPPTVPSVSQELGHEIDAHVSYRPWAPLELQGGWAGVIYGDGAKSIMSAYRRGYDPGDGTIKAPSFGQFGYVSAKLRLP